MNLRRGDTGKFKFQRLDAEGQPITTIADEVYFTVKKNTKTQDYLIQKKLEDMTFDEDGTYHFVIEPEDTNSLKYSDDYVYDIEVTQDGDVSTIALGTFSLQEEVTFASNKGEQDGE